MLELVILDGDGTLWDMQSLYDRAKAAFAAVVSEAGGSSDGVVERLDEIDSELVSEMGFGPNRFREALRLAYLRELGTDRPLGEPVSRRLDAIWALTLQSPDPFPEVHEVLGRLSRRYRLALLSKGDFDTQRDKVTQTQTGRYFERVALVPSKSSEDLAKLIASMGTTPEQCCVIGDSIRSDVNPALLIGAHAILMAHPTWRWEQSEVPLREVPLAADLAEAERILAQIDQVAPATT